MLTLTSHTVKLKGSNIHFEENPLFEGDKILEWQKFSMPLSLFKDALSRDLAYKGSNLSEEETEALYKKYSANRKLKITIPEVESMGFSFLGSSGTKDYYCAILESTDYRKEATTFVWWDFGKRRSMMLLSEDIAKLREYLTV